MRARVPDREGLIDRDGVAIHYEVHGEVNADGAPTVLLVPPSPITDSRIWKALLPTLARRHRVVTLDGRGGGRSGRPAAAGDHSRAANVADIVAVLDATGTERAVVAAHCHANWWAVELAAHHPERVMALISLAPGVPYLGRPQPHWVTAAATWEHRLVDPQGWELFNRHVITTEHRRWVEFFFREQLVEPHSTKQYEDAVAWALESTGDILAASEEGQELDPPTRDEFEDQCRRLVAPVLVVHGDRDVCQHVDKGRAFAALTHATLVEIEGGGHLALVRDPVRVHRAIADFLGSIGLEVPERRWVRARRRPPRALYLSSPIGLGHALRDVSIAEELRRLRPDVQVDWLAQHPVTTLLERRGEHIHPASSQLANESSHVEDEAGEHDLHAFQAIRRMDEILAHNFMLFDAVVEDERYDLVIADEAWDVDYFLHENPELKRFEFAWMTDFVGWLPMPDGGDAEAALAVDYNAEMIEQRARYRRLRDRSIFVGDPEDVVPEPFGAELPSIREWTEANFEFSGYITGFDPAELGDRDALRAELGYRPDERVCVVTVGGSGVGGDVVRRIVDAVPAARRLVHDLRFEVVLGPRLDPTAFPRRRGVRYHRYVPNLYRHLAASDLAIVQGGLTTCMELTANRRPFVYVPLQHHFEQQFHVHHRLRRHRAGRRLDYPDTADPERLADTIVAELGRTCDYLPVDPAGAARAAASIAELL